jgi:hypothetical protein
MAASRHSGEDGRMPIRLPAFCVGLAFIAGCASAPAPSTAVVSVSAIAPPAGSEISQSSVLEATVGFTISNFQLQADTYYLVTQFQAADGTSFNHSPRLADHSILTAAQGSVLVRYPLSRVWADPRLKKPVRLWFELVAKVGPNDSVVIGRSTPIEYAAK